MKIIAVAHTATKHMQNVAKAPTIKIFSNLSSDMINPLLTIAYYNKLGDFGQETVVFLQHYKL